MHSVLEYSALTLFSALFLYVGRSRAWDRDPMSYVIIPSLLWPVGLPLGTIIFVKRGIQRDRYGDTGRIRPDDCMAIVISIVVSIEGTEGYSSDL